MVKPLLLWFLSFGQAQLSLDICKPVEFPILSYHVHAVFNGSNFTESENALAIYHRFLQAASAPSECPFSHANPAIGFNRICAFDFNATMAAFPFPASGVFHGSNFAFFIPRDSGLYLWASDWWRQHTDVTIGYVFHVNTGCEDMDHTRWAVTSEGYKCPVVSRSHLYCCHAPPRSGCYCDIAQYSNMHGTCLGVETGGSSQRFLQQTAASSSNYDLRLRFDMDCEQGQFIGGASWRETYYQDPRLRTAAEIEWFGLEWRNVYYCLAPATTSGCDVNSDLILVPCSKGGVNQTRTLLIPDFKECEKETLCKGELRVSMCSKMCVGLRESGELALVKCESDKATLMRTRLLG